MNELEADFFGDERVSARFTVVAVPLALLDRAARLVAVHGLRAHDALRLASGLAVREADPDCTWFARFDQGLRRAAADGFSLVP